ncbi:hypothetical protein AAIR98_001013 [Elusimicrobium simillimum]|uniref:lysylphosphatidylglycerol synthase transmembrane domain-containing protein n=1 Tax=Elusimicrobium simillimum TaxID=3143438 RepID=UPI003C7025E9
MKSVFKKIFNKYTIYTLLGIVSIALVVFLFNYSKEEFIKIWREVKVKYLILSGISAVTIYISMGLSLWEVLKAMGKRINVFTAIAIALVSTTVNYLVSSFGVSGFALRAHLLGRRGVPLGVSVTASIVLTVVIYLVLVIIIFLGSILMLFHSNPTTTQVLQNLLLIIAMAGVCALIIVFLFHNDIRASFVRKVFKLINKVSYKLFTLIIPKYRFDIFVLQLETGINFIQQKKGRLTRAIVYVCLDWLATILILYFAFLAVGIHISAGLLVTGFAVGMATTLIPVLPGGIGAMELAMTAVYANAGIPWENALTVCLIYRFMYYIIPGLVSIFVYWVLQLTDHKNQKRFAHYRRRSKSMLMEGQEGGEDERKN